MSEPTNVDDKTNTEEKTSIDNSQWQEDFKKEDLEIPYKREEAQEEEEENEETEEEEVPQAEPINSLVTLEDPGDFTPTDFSFEYDIDGKKYTISSSEDIDKIPEEDLEKLSAAKITKLLRQANSVDAKTERERAEYDDKMSKYQEQVSAQEEQSEVIEGFAAEFDYLVAKGFLPKVPDSLKNADWNDSSVSSQEGVKQQVEVINYMVKENDVRAKAGLKPLTSIVDAFNAMQMDSKRKNEAKADKAQKQQRKSAGGRIASATNNMTSSPVPNGIAVGRVNAFSRSQDIWQ